MTMKDKKMTELKPCPFCGTKFVWIDRYGDYFYVYCRRFACHIHGPERLRKDTAIAAWNRRAEQKAKEKKDA